MVDTRPTVLLKKVSGPLSKFLQNWKPSSWKENYFCITRSSLISANDNFEFTYLNVMESLNWSHDFDILDVKTQTGNSYWSSRLYRVLNTDWINLWVVRILIGENAKRKCINWTFLTSISQLKMYSSDLSPDHIVIFYCWI